MADQYWYKGSLTEDAKYLGTGSVTLDVKHIFLSFLQKFFEKQDRYKWSSDIRTSKVIIADKNAIDLGVVERRPSIILSRGNLGWAYATRGQGSLGHDPMENVKNLGDLTMQMGQRGANISDLVQGSVTINCLAKYGLQSEEIANLIFFAIAGNKRGFYEKGVHSISNLAMGEESILRSNSGVELTTVPISFNYSLPRDLRTSFQTADVVVYWTPPTSMSGYEETALYEGSAFSINASGNAITLFSAVPSGSSLTASYTKASDSSSVVKQDLSGAINGANKVYFLPNNDSAYGYYKIFASGVISVEGLSTASGISHKLIVSGEISG